MRSASRWMRRGYLKSEARGVLVAADAGHEWLLPWWWRSYAAHNPLPVAFVDFGMSKRAKRWCAARGALLTLPFSPADFPLAEVSAEKRHRWEAIYGPQLWTARRHWFLKPTALLHTPYQRTVWLDLDCEVLGDIGDLLCLPTSKVALAQEPTCGGYNSGVIVYEKGAEEIVSWAEHAHTDNAHFLGDQDLFSHLIQHKGWEIFELPQVYNWRLSQGVPAGAKIVHWAGAWGKEYIRTYGGLQGLP